MSKRSSSRRDGAQDASLKDTSLQDSSRRNFLKGATIAGAAALGTPAAANTAMQAFPQARPKATVPGPKLAAADSMPPPADPVNQSSSGGDFMVDVLKTLDIDYLAMNCASSFRGLHEAVINLAATPGPRSSPVRTRRSRCIWGRATPRWQASRWP
jgi:acetolactate synthase I/II/III large subunit